MSSEELIGAVHAGPDSLAVPVQRELAGRGAAVLPLLLKAVENAVGPSQRRLCEVVGLIRDPEAIPDLIALLDGPSFELQGPAVAALAQLPDERALPALLERWSWTDDSALAYALAQIGGPLVAAAFADRLRRWSVGDLPVAACGLNAAQVHTLAVMTAALSGQDEAQAFRLLHAVARDAKRATVRGAAIHAMWRRVGPGCLETLRVALRDRDSENRQSAVHASYFLGVGALVPDLVAVGTSDSDPKVSATAREALMRIGGLPLTHEAPSLDAVRAWFEQTGQYLEPGTAYRGGLPIHPRIVAGMIEREPRGPADRAFEFELLTGAGLPHRASDGVPAEQWGPLAVEWAEAHADAFVPGAVYRGGVRCEVSE